MWAFWYDAVITANVITVRASEHSLLPPQITGLSLGPIFGLPWCLPNQRLHITEYSLAAVVATPAPT